MFSNFRELVIELFIKFMKKEKVVIIIAIGPREKFYERLLKRIR